MIVPLQPDHVAQVARLHCRSLTGLLTRLGYRAAEAFYEGCVESPAATALVFVEAGRVIGFVAGSADPALLKRQVTRANPWKVFFGLLVGVLRRPAALIDLAAGLKAPPVGAYDPKTPELTYLAVSSEARGEGVGERLVQAFARALAGGGESAFELSVDSDNLGAIRFYERLGFVALGEYREFSTTHRRYRLPLAEFKIAD